MRLYIPYRTLLVVFIAIVLPSRGFSQLQCDNDTTGLKALIDLKFGTYLGYQGGLYPGGFNNIPLTHFLGGMNCSRRVLPRNFAGEVDWEDGEVGFIAMGASTAGNAFNHFKSIANVNPEVNQCIKFVNTTVGAKGIESMIDTVDAAWYWEDYVMPDLDSASISPKQVQVAWIMVTSRIDTLLIWPYQPIQVTDKYEALMGVLMSKFPNLQMVFVSGFPYGGYADPIKEFYEMIAEPSSYWNNWTVKWLVQRQIAADPDLKYTNPGKNSPWIGWGPHLWADGLRPNFTDGLRWDCYVDFKPDGGGYHLSNEGKQKEGEIILDFFLTSTVTTNWFKHNPRWESCDSIFRENPGETYNEVYVNVFPNPSSGKFYFEIENPVSETVDLEIINSMGQVILRRQLTGINEYDIEELDIAGQPKGLYHILVTNGTRTFTRSLILE